jgi:adenosylhomocysteine nucleosidase|tara:strand:+ start:848 stop:1633 length:786 start_codon:yes stop_codon:yes gene_type:complete
MIGIMSAMQEEVRSLLQSLKNPKEITKGMRTYYTGVLFDKKCVIVFSRWGKVAAASTATQLINDYNLNEIIFTGVAGAMDPSLNIGDVVIGKELFQHDLNATPFYQKFHIPILDLKSITIKTNDRLLKSTHLFFDNYNAYIDKTESAVFKIYSPKVIIGDIATGDQFISSKQKMNDLKNELPSAMCVEMEGAAVAQVCLEYEVPFSIFRIISDKANDNAHIDFSRFANSIASNYALGILKEYFSYTLFFYLFLSNSMNNAI